MKKLFLALFLLQFVFVSCKESKVTQEQSRKDLELKEKELSLKEKELELKEKELDNRNSAKAEGNLNSSGGEGSIPDMSSVLLDRSYLENKDAWELRIMRNEIYARHGYIFKLPELREYFMKQSWYEPVNEDVTNSLSLIEKENIELIKRYEEYIGSRYSKYSR
ncbi:MAG TPA: YARHG domain-containing protein [Ignavibacteria bacterium]|nr:YARHG domain-containing protein [Ignavibacteria bacterium]